MKSLFYYAEKYLDKSSWKDISVLKFCLFSMGVIVGIQIPERKKEYVRATALLVFLATYIPLMAKFFGIVVKDE